MIVATGTMAQISALVTHTALSVWTNADNFLIVIIPLSALILFAWFVGRGSLIALLIAFYGAYALYVVFPYMSSLPTASPLAAFLTHFGLYAAFVFIFFIIVRRVIASDFLSVGTFGLVALSALGAAFLISLASHVFLVSSFYHLTPSVSELFEPAKYFFWWFIGPAVGLLFFAR
jgi:hypothetical protein